MEKKKKFNRYSFWAEYSNEREISLKTGKSVLKHLKKKNYKVKELDAKGHFVKKIKKIKPKAVFNALHGKYGEDGFVQSNTRIN